MANPPLRGRLHRYQLTTSERALLNAMCEANSEGSMVYAAIPRLAAYAALSDRHVRRLIHGYFDKRTSTRVKGLVERGILTVLAKPGSRKRTAIYRVNEDALHLAPEMRPYLEQAAQQQLPGILKPAKVGVAQRPVGDETLSSRTLCPPSTDSVSAQPGHGVRLTPDTVSADSKAFDSRTIDSKAGEFRRPAPTLSDCRPEDLAKKLCERTAFPDTHSNVAVVAAAIKAIRTQHGATHGEAAASLERCVQYVQSKNYPDLRVDRFFFEDAKYNLVHPVFLNSVRSQPSQEPMPAVCKTCAGEGRLHLQPHQPSVNGSRLIPCPDCSQMESRATA